jgi:orotate phosphoribosyltransferase
MMNDLSSISVPSGRIFDNADIAFVQAIAAHASIRFEREQPIQLVSGRTSRVYGRFRSDVTDDPLYLSMIARLISKAVRAITGYDVTIQPCLLPVPQAGSPFACATSLYEQFAGFTLPIGWRPTRSMPKIHGATDLIDGTPSPHQWYGYLEAVSTTGRSTTKFVEDTAHLGFSHKKRPTFAIVLVSRSRFVETTLKARVNGPVWIMYHMRDILHAIGQLGVWPDDDIRDALNELNSEW